MDIRRGLALPIIAATLLTACTPAVTFPDPAENSALMAESSTYDELAAELQTLVDEVVASYGGNAVIAVSDGETELIGGPDLDYPAWSTVKVPIAVAALRADPDLREVAAAAIQISDNDAADYLWSSLPAGAADEILSEADAPLTINDGQHPPEYRTFGSTDWPSSGQAHFMANLGCVDGAGPVLELMADIDPSQSQGLGELPDARFKGGWGPDEEDAYLYRQMGLVGSEHGDIAVSLTVEPASGTLEDAQSMAGSLARGLGPLLDRLPSSSCQPG